MTLMLYKTAVNDIMVPVAVQLFSHQPKKPVRITAAWSPAHKSDILKDYHCSLLAQFSIPNLPDVQL